MYDVILRGGQVADGTGAPQFRADVAIADNRVVAVGALGEASARETVDVSGKIVFPGFVDTHVHVDALAADADVQLAALRQGVTTVIAGQDGISFAPASATTITAMSQYFAAVNGDCPAALAGGASVADLLAHYDAATALNVAYAIPAGTVRAEVMGYAQGPADAQQLRGMRLLVEQGLADGAVGLSTGLEYVPGRYADAAELAELCAPVAAAGAVYVSHMRGYEAEAWRGLDEAFTIARRAGVPTHISHLHGPSHMITGLLDEARAAGVDVTFDSYPYLKGCSILAMVALPADIQVGGPEATLERLRTPGVRDELARNYFPRIDDVLGRITLAYVGAPVWAWTEGLSLLDAAAQAGMAPGELVCELVAESRLGAGCVFAQPPTNTDDDVRRLLRHEAQMVGSDAIFLGARPHPRGWGTFARFLARHTRQLGDWTWGEASLHLAGHPARRFGLADRGVIRAGAIADLTVIDPATVADLASYAEPRTPATGVDDVMVSGRWVLRGGSLTGTLAGRGLRHGRAE